MYLPLLVCENFSVDRQSRNPSMQELLRQSFQDTDSICGFLYFGDFLKQGNEGIHKPFNDYFMKHKKKIFSIYGIREQDWQHDRNCMADIIYPFLLTEKWGRCKQVYAFDAELEFALADTDEIKIPVHILDRLPFSCFYIEFAKDGIFSSEHHGSFVHVIRTPSRTHAILFLRLGTDNRMDTLMIRFDQGPDDGTFLINRTSDIEGRVGHPDMEEFSMFVLNAILYLCAENAEVSENPVTKTTYRQYSTPKNKFSEIRKWDCGIRYGTAVRKHRQKSQDSSGKQCKGQGHTSSVRPHMRRAHWHHYRTGKGRTELVLRWIEPVMVGTGEVCTVIHKIADEKE